MILTLIGHSDDLNGSTSSTFACKTFLGCKAMSKLSNISLMTYWMHLKPFKIDFEVKKICIKNQVLNGIFVTIDFGHILKKMEFFAFFDPPGSSIWMVNIIVGS